jgi:hypothetical protein
LLLTSGCAGVVTLQVAAKQSRLDQLRASKQTLQQQLLEGPQPSSMPPQVVGEGLL